MVGIRRGQLIVRGGGLGLGESVRRHDTSVESMLGHAPKDLAESSAAASEFMISSPPPMEIVLASTRRKSRPAKATFVGLLAVWEDVNTLAHRVRNPPYVCLSRTRDRLSSTWTLTT